MLQQLRLQNFRGFEDHLVPLRPLTVIVGANNAGKSTVVEALRLIALVVSRLRRGSMQFVPVPDWLRHADAFRGIQPALRGRGFEGHGPSTFHHYRDPPAVVTATFSSGVSVLVFVGPDGEIHGAARDKDGTAVGTARDAKSLELTPLAIQPQVAPLLREERILAEETVRRGEGTYLAPQHFRNQLFRSDHGYAEFREMAEASWPGLQIKQLGGDELHPDEPLQLHVRDNDFVGEVSLMGHGLQMWLQTVWFLARTERGATVVLDEPDVYMHPDLQRRVLELVRDRFDQLLIATHSIEIVSDVAPGSILSVDRRQPESTFVTDLPGVQEVIDRLGGVHHIQITRLFRSRSFVLVEGDDMKLLRILQRVHAPNAPPIDLVPNGELSGRGGWSTAILTRLPRKNAHGETIRSYCLLDRDYFPDEEIAERYEEAKQWRIDLRIWSRKELENFLLVPDAICRFIGANARPGTTPPAADDVAGEIDRIVDSMRQDPITDGFGTVFLSRDRRGGFATANRRAQSLVAARWNTRAGRWALSPGKQVISRLSDWSRKAFGVSFGPEQLARSLEPSEIDSELVDVLQAVPIGRRLEPSEAANR